MSGEITEINSTLVDAPENINKDPHGSAWLIKIKLERSRKKLASLMDAAAYEAYIAEASQRNTPA